MDVIEEPFAVEQVLLVFCVLFSIDGALEVVPPRPKNDTQVKVPPEPN